MTARGNCIARGAMRPKFSVLEMQVRYFFIQILSGLVVCRVTSRWMPQIHVNCATDIFKEVYVYKSIIVHRSHVDNRGWSYSLANMIYKVSKMFSTLQYHLSCSEGDKTIKRKNIMILRRYHDSSLNCLALEGVVSSHFKFEALPKVRA